MIYNGDCLEVMKDIASQSIDMILCDLPYGNTDNKWDVIIPFNALWQQYERVIKDNGAIVLTAQQPFASDLIQSNKKMFRYEIIWEKSQLGGFLNAKKMPMRGHENVLIFYKRLPTYNPQKKQTIGTGRVRNAPKCETSTNYQYHKKDDYSYTDDGSRFPSSVIKIGNWNGALFGNTEGAVKHPTQKPVPLFEYLIKTYTNEGETVLDNCAGSFTTAIACINTNRKYICIEKEEKYFNMGKMRIEKHLQKQKELLFTNETIKS